MWAVVTAMTPQRFRSTAAWQRARARALSGATHCALCGGALRYDVRPTHPLAPSVDHVRPLEDLDLNTAADRAIALDPALLRPSHQSCNSARGNGGHSRRRRKGRPARRQHVVGLQLAPQLVRADPAIWLGPPKAVVS